MSDAATGTVRIGYVRVLLDYLTHHQYPIERFFPKQLLELLNSSSLNERIPVADWRQLLENAVMLVDDEQLPLKLAKKLTPKHGGVLAYASMTCRNLAEVVAILGRYERLIDEVNDTHLIRQGDNVQLQWIPRLGTPAPAFMQLSLASWVIFARRYTQRNDLVADVDFTFDEPKNTEQYQQIFGGQLRFQQSTTQLIFPTDYLQLPITYHDPESHRALLSQAQIQIDNLRNQLHHDNTLFPQLRNAIIQQLSRGGVALEHIAEQLNVPARTLQHQLEHNGTSFRKLLDEIRLELAQIYLKDQNMSLADIAFLLGYSEQSPFSKAFKRWTGQTPGEYRKHCL
jgi:AraC-like DNA-binding protein